MTDNKIPQWVISAYNIGRFRRIFSVKSTHISYYENKGGKQ